MCGKAAAAREEQAARAALAHAFDSPGVHPARYPSRCSTCGDRINPGDPIKHTDDGWSGVECCHRELL
jgi:hypothetical protein